MKLPSVSLAAILLFAGVPVDAEGGANQLRNLNDISAKSTKRIKRGKSGKDTSGDDSKVQDPIIVRGDSLDIQDLAVCKSVYNSTAKPSLGFKDSNCAKLLKLNLGVVEASDEASVTGIDLTTEIVTEIAALELQFLPNYFFGGYLQMTASIQVQRNCSKAACVEAKENLADWAFPDEYSVIELYKDLTGSPNNTAGEKFDATHASTTKFYAHQEPGIPYFYQLQLYLNTRVTTEEGNLGQPLDNYTIFTQMKLTQFLAKLTPGITAPKNVVNKTASDFVVEEYYM